MAYLCPVILKQKPMKKFSLFVIALLMAVAVSGKKENSEKPVPQSGDPIELKEILILPLPGPKSMVTPVSAWFIHKPCMIGLSIHDPQGPMVVTIEDNSEQVIVKQTVDGNHGYRASETRTNSIQTVYT